MLTGDRLTDAQPGFDNQTQEPAVHLTLDATGARIFKDVTRENVGKRMAILLIEKGKGEVVTAPVIRTEIGGGRVQISRPHEHGGSQRHGAAAARRLACRADGDHRGAHRRPEPRRGQHREGLQFDACGASSPSSAFMIVYYVAVRPDFLGLRSASNLLFLVALLSLLQATLTLPGIAAIALTLGMAIDANVLINERIREEAAQRRDAAGGDPRPATSAPSAPSSTPTSPP